DDSESLRVSGKWADLLPSIPEGMNYLYHTERGEGRPPFGWRRRYWSFLLKLAKARPAWQLVATDASPAALHVARDNAATLNLAHRVCFQQGDWCDALPAGRFAALVSNPPYIAADDPHLAALGFEPATALVAAENGLADLRRIAEQAPAHLLSGGWLLLEHGWQQGAAVRDLLSRLGYHQIETHHDLGGQERVTSARIGEEHTDG
ncbi:MAG TPA: HemK/PrmC family methyltransferase, partial [Pseudomonadales bacterium]|nr:HemK/PrmC family methyltransferase [Pseudomonadales bacterium]